MTKPTKRFTRQITDPNGDFVSLNEHCGTHLINGRAVALKQGGRIIGYYDKWPEQTKLEYIRDEFIRVMRDPRNAADPDWTILAA